MNAWIMGLGLLSFTLILIVSTLIIRNGDLKARVRELENMISLWQRLKSTDTKNEDYYNPW